MVRPKGTPPALEAQKRANVLQVLFKCARLVNERAIERVNDEAGRRLLRPAVTNVLPHISFDGTPVGEIAKNVTASGGSSGAGPAYTTVNASRSRVICSDMGRGAVGVFFPYSLSTFSQTKVGPGPAKTSSMPAVQAGRSAKV